jgi:UDPglucose--hexose-1-phosphate uridylyltransferase
VRPVAELRQDVVTGRWVVVASERAMRPSDFAPSPPRDVSGSEECPFCPGREIMTPLEVYAVRPGGGEPNTPGWKVRVVPNKYPAFGPGEPQVESKELFPRRSADGSHEVIIHTPDHEAHLETMDARDVEVVLRVYRLRYDVNSKKDAVRYIHILVNQGMEAGASLEHSHSQLFGAPLVPPLVQQELAGASWFMTSRGSCVFCNILESELAAGERIVCANEAFVAFAPFASRLPFEVWIVPRRHQESFGMISDDQVELFAEIMQDLLRRYGTRLGEPAYNYYIHSAPCDGSEHPYYHWHVEMVPKLTCPGSYEMGTLMMINICTPESAAAHLAE